MRHVTNLQSTANAPLDPTVQPTMDDAIAEAEPPLVARWMIELRSDGTRTTARAVAEQFEHRERVAFTVDGNTTTLTGLLAFARSLIRFPAALRTLRAHAPTNEEKP